MLQGKSDADVVELLAVLPVSGAEKICLGLSCLSDDANAFVLLRPIVRSECSKLSFERKLFRRWTALSDAAVDAEIRQAVRHGTRLPPEAWDQPSQWRRRRFFLGLLTRTMTMVKDGEVMPAESDRQSQRYSELESEDSDDDDDEENAADGALAAVEADFEAAGCRLVMMEPTHCTLPASECISRTTVLTKRHLLLPLLVAKKALGFSKKTRKLVCDWPGGTTSLGDKLCLEHLFPAAHAAVRSVSTGEFQEAFGSLFGILLHGRLDDGWLRDNEVHLEYTSFRCFFDSVSDAWSAVLSQSDELLGLRPPCGVPAGYREPVVALLDHWVRETNATLLERYDEHAAGGRKARLKICPAPPPPKKLKAVAPSMASKGARPTLKTGLGAKASTGSSAKAGATSSKTTNLPFKDSSSSNRRRLFVA